MISILAPGEVQQSLALAFKRKRKFLKHSRKKASIISGVPEPTIRKFEGTGQISLRQFMLLCTYYGDLSDFDKFFPKPIARTIDELIALEKMWKKLEDT